MAWDDIFDPYGDGSLVDPMHEELTKEDKLGSEAATESDIEIESTPEPPAEPDATLEMMQGEDPFEAGYQAELERMESEEMQYKLGESAVPSLDDVSRNKKIAEGLGVPLESVEMDPAGAAQKLRAQNSAAILEITPKVKNHLKDPENTPGLAHASEELSFWEMLSDDAKHGWASGELIYEIGVLATDSNLAKDPDKQKELLEKALLAQEILRNTPQSESIFGGAGFVGSAVEQLGLMKEILPYVIGTAATTGVINALTGFLAAGPAGAGTMFTVGAGAGAAAATVYQTSKIEEGHAFLEMLEQGIDEETALDIAKTVGAVNGLLELTGAIGWTKPIKDMVVKAFKQEVVKGLKEKTTAVAIKNTLKAWGKAIATETSTEFAQEVSNIVGADVGRYLEPGMDPKMYSEEGRAEIGSQIVHILDKTAKTMFLLGSPFATYKLHQELKEIKQTENTVKMLKAIGDVSQNSEAMGKLPDEMQKAVEAATKDGPVEKVYIQADKFEEYFQDGIEAVAEELGITDQLENLEMLKEKGGSVEIPIGVYAEKIARDKEAHAFLGNHSKINPEHATPDQARKMDEAIASAVREAEETIAKVQTDAVVEESSKRVFEKVKNMAMEDGKTSADQATQQATLTQARIVRMAADESERRVRLGGKKVLPHELWEEKGFDLDLINRPLEITAQDFKEQGIPTAEQLEEQGYDAIRILPDEELAKTDRRFAKRQQLSLRRFKESQQVQPERQTLDQPTAETEALDPTDATDALIIKARQGDESAQATLKEYGLEWDFEPIVRFVAKGEVDTLLKGERQQGKFDDGRVDVTKDIEGKDVPATNKDYRIRLKDSFDDKASNSKVQMKNEQDGWLEGGYDLNDVATIEERQPDGSWEVVHQAADPETQALDQATAAVKAESGFDAFIEGSQVVDEKGEPLVVYHGTDKNFTSFSKDASSQLGSHFGTSEQANSRIEQTRMPVDDEVSEDVLDYSDTRVIPVYLNIKNPLRLPDLEDWLPEDVAGVLLDRGMIDEERYEILTHTQSRINYTDYEGIREEIEEAGYDGIVYKNEVEGAMPEGKDFRDAEDSYIAFHPEQIKSIFAKKFDPTSPDILEQSAAPLQKKPLKIEGTGKKGQITNWNIAEAFTKRHDKKYGRKLDPVKNEEDYKIVLRELNKEYKDQATEQDAGADWYIEDINEAVEITKLIIPELADPVKKELFLAIVAFTSPNNAPLNNWEVAVQVMQGYIKNGKIPTKRLNKKTGKWTGKNLGVKSLRTGTQLLQKLIDKHGEAGALAWISETKSGAELAQLRKESGLFTKKRLLSGYAAGETNMSGEWHGAAAMGPKVSEFFLNVAGLNQDALTIDLWAARTYNRLIGRLLDVPAGKKKSKTIVQDLRGKAERDVIKRLFRELAKKNNIDPSAMQAALWYFEQRLFRNHGATAKSENFSGAATRAAEAREITIPRRSEDGQRSVRSEDLDVQELFQRTVQELEQAPVRRAKLDPVWYFSALTEALNSLPESKTQPKSAKEWAQIIKPGMAKGVTKDEIIWTGLEQFLAHQHKDHKVERAQARVNTAKESVKHWESTYQRSGLGIDQDNIKSAEDHLKKMEAGLKRELEDTKEPKISLEHIREYLARRGVRVIDVTQTMPVEDIENDPEFGVLRDDITERLVDERMEEKINAIVSEDLQLLDEIEKTEVWNGDTEAYKKHHRLSLEQTARRELYADGSLQVEAHAEALGKFEARGGKFEGRADLPGGEYHELLLTLPEDRFIPLDQVPVEIKYVQDKLLDWAKQRDKLLPDPETRTLQLYEKKKSYVGSLRNWMNGFSEFVAANKDTINRHVSEARFSGVLDEAHVPEEYMMGMQGVLEVGELALYLKYQHLHFELGIDGEFRNQHKKSKTYMSSHWDDHANVIAHVRFKARYRYFDKEGQELNEAEWGEMVEEAAIDFGLPEPEGITQEKVLFIEEFQSDWGKTLRNALDSERRQKAEGPFVGDTKNWTELAVKRMIAYAMENGYDRIEWSNGLQQSGHYKLIEHMDGVRWNPDTKILSVLKKGEIAFTTIAHSVEAEELPKYLGQEVASRLLKTVATKQQLADHIEMPEPSFDPVYAAYELFDQVPHDEIRSRFPAVMPREEIEVMAVQDLEMTEELYVLKSDPRTGVRRVVDRDPDPRIEPEFREEYFDQVDLSTGVIIQGPFESLADAMIDVAEELNLFPAQPETDFHVEGLFKKIEEADFAGGYDVYVFEAEPNNYILLDERNGTFKHYKPTQIGGQWTPVLEDEFDTLEAAMNAVASDMGMGKPAPPISKIKGLLPNDKVLTGIDLETTGEEMGEYYDLILPNTVIKVLKDLGITEPDINATPMFKEEKKKKKVKEKVKKRLRKKKEAGETLSADETLQLESEYIEVTEPVLQNYASPGAHAKAYTPGAQPGFDMTPVNQALTDQEGRTKRIALFQDKRKKDEESRASFIPGEVFGGAEERSIITLFENRDLSSFLHESGHWYFETLRDLANQPGASEQIVKDMEALLEFASPGMDLDTWNSMSYGERKTAHEKVARAFEAYLFEGKAPSQDLKQLFRRFRDWLIAVYRTIIPLDVKLNDDVREVFDRMLATDDQIQTAKSLNEYEALFGTEEESGVDPARWAAYQATLAQGDASAKEKLQARSLQNLKWYEGAKSRYRRRMEREQRLRREDVKSEMLDTYTKQKVYQVITWLRQPVDKLKRVKTEVNKVVPEQDSLFVAISKLGGINKQQLIDQWGLDPKTKFETYKPVARAKEGGLTIDEMGIQLAQEGLGYLPVDENGKYDPHDFEDRFFNELAGRKSYSTKNERHTASEELEDEYFKFLQERDEASLKMSMKVKLSIPMLRELFGPGEEWENLPKGRWGLMSEEGIDPKLVAELFEYRSVEEMMKEILEAPPLKEIVEAKTDERMLELYGDMHTPEQREKAVMEALHDDLRTKQVHTELSFLTGTGVQNIRAKDAREWAREQVAKVKVRDLKPGKYYAQERRSARAAMEAVRKGNREEAIGHQRAVIWNHHMAREMEKAAEEVERAVRYFNKFNNKTTRKAIEPAFRDQIDALLEQYDFRVSVTEAELADRASLGAWIAEQEGIGITPVIPEHILALTRLRHYRDVPLDELRGLKDAVKNIDHIGRWNNKLRLAKEKQDLQEVVDAINASIREFAPDRPPDLRASLRLPQDFWGQFRAKYFAEHRKVANLGWLFDGFKYGPFWKSFMRPLNERADWETVENAKATEKLGELFDVFSALDFAPRWVPGGVKDERLYVRKHFKSINKTLSKMERIMIAMNWGNEVNRIRLMEGYGWSEANVQEILNTLSERDWSFVMGVWEFIDSYWPEMKAKEERVHGVAPEKVQGIPIKTKIDGNDVTLNANGKVGYFPIIADELLSGKGLIDQQRAIMDQARKGAIGQAMTRSGHLKARKPGDYGEQLRLDFNAITQHVTQVVHDLAWHEALIDANRISTHPQFQETVIDEYGINIWEQIPNMLRDVAVGTAKASTFTERLMGPLRKGVSVAYMAWNLGTAYLQIFGLSQGFQRAGTKWVAKGMAQSMTGALAMESWLQKTYDMSEGMEHRGSTMMREINELQNQIGMKGFFAKIKADHVPDVLSHFYLIGKMQQMVDVPIFHGAYQRFIEEGVDGEQVDEPTAIAMAHQMVIDTQGSGHIKDQAAIQRGGPGLQLFTSFISYFQVTFQLYVDALAREGIYGPRSFFREIVKDRTKLGRLAVDYWLLTTLPILAVYYLKDAIIKGECDYGRDMVCTAKKLAADHGAYAMSGMVGPREVTGMLYGGYFADYQGPAGTRIWAETSRLGKEVLHGKWDTQPDTLLKKARIANKVGGILFHYPSQQLDKLCFGFLDYQSGKTRNPAAPFFGYSKQ